MGIRLKQEQPKRHRVIISSVALPYFVPSFIFSIAFIPKGVAALDIPSKFALMQAVISSVAVSFLNEDGNIHFSKGRISFDKAPIAPLSFKTFIIPFQSAIIPIRDNVTLTLFDAPSIMPLQSSAQFPIITAVTVEEMARTENIFPIIFSPFM